jgi:CRISPR locus-related DNA-binding protein
MTNVTLIATFYSTEPFMPAALAFSPKKIILVVDTLDKTVKSNISAVEKTFGAIAKVETLKVERDNIYDTASKIVAQIDKEPHSKDNKIVVHVAGGWKTLANGVLYGCYARADRIYKIEANKATGNELSELPKLNYNLSTAKREVLMKIVKRNDKAVAQIASELKRTKGMVYQHLRELKDAGYVDESFNITDAGRLALL